MKEIETQLAERDVVIKLEEDARAYLAEKGYDPDMGARPLARLMEDELKKPLTNELLFGNLEDGGLVRVGTSTLKEGGKELTFICEPPAAANSQSDAGDD